MLPASFVSKLLHPTTVQFREFATQDDALASCVRNPHVNAFLAVGTMRGGYHAYAYKARKQL